MNIHNKLIQFTLFILMIASLGCTKDVEIALPPYIPTLVIHSYISPKDSGVTVYVNLSKPAFNNNYDLNNVTNATVKISDGVKTSILNFHYSLYGGGLTYYFIDSNNFKISVGKTYNLNVTTPDGKAASASTTIPTIVPVSSLESHLIKNQFGDSAYKISFTFNDPAGQDDYYKFGAYIIERDTVLYQQSNITSDEKYGIYFNSDGNLISESIESQPWFSSFLAPDQIRFLDFRLMHVTREYYLYHQSIQNAGGGGPFTEPSVAFTNITGGVGVFAGYNYDQRILR